MSATAITTATAIELKSVPNPENVSGASLAVASGLPSGKAQSVRSGETATPRSDDASRNGSFLVDGQDPSRFTTTIVIVLVTLVTALSSLLAGVITVAIPSVALDINLSPSLILWPASINSLVCGCTLLLSGSVSDVVGSRFMYMTGTLLQGVFNVASGLSQTGSQLIAFRGLAGLAVSFSLPSATAVITETFPPGQKRNVAFACMGGGQPIGFALGLTLGGILAQWNWRFGFYLPAILNFALFVIAWFAIPRDDRSTANMGSRLVHDIDWVGALLASAALAMISYVFASITSSTSAMSHPTNIVLLTISLLLFPAFHFWVARQERLQRPALIPPSLWRSKVFTSICLSVFSIWGSFNALEQLLSFYFQYVQLLSPMAASVRFLAEPVSGIVGNVAAGLLVQRVRGDVLVLTTTALSLVSPTIMALASPTTSYWKAAFPAIICLPAAADMLFTVSNLVITSKFPTRTQGLAGGVFQTVSQIGKAVGLALSAVVANSITEKSQYSNKESPEALMEGYRAAWWFTFGLSAVTLVIGVLGLRKVGKVGLKKD